jgi:uncharacterized protein
LSGIVQERVVEMVHDLAVAFCLMLVIEGVIPFIAPKRWRKLILMLDQIDDNTMRGIGLGSMLVGTALLYIIN